MVGEIPTGWKIGERHEEDRLNQEEGGRVAEIRSHERIRREDKR